MDKIAQEVLENGYAVIENFLSDDEVNSLLNAGKSFTSNAAQEAQKTIFSTSSRAHEKSQYFLDSSDKIGYFFEENALDDQGNLLVDAAVSLNKVGHNFHWLHPVFKGVTFSDKVKQVCKGLQMVEPSVVQSMYIYKNPRIGGEVTPHQDSSYLYTEPDTLYGFWFALHDATEENGCLFFIPGSHNISVYERMIKYKDANQIKLKHVGNKPEFDNSTFKGAPVKKGSCVVLHGRVVHRSSENRSQHPRNAYVFHIYDKAKSHYSEENWLQTATFPLLYENKIF